MAATQVGTGGLTLGAPQTAAATYIDVPVGGIVESVNVDMPGDSQMDTQYDGDGAFHADIWYEKRLNTASVVVVGKAFVGSVGDRQGSSEDYEIVAIAAEYSKGPVRTTVNVKWIGAEA